MNKVRFNDSKIFIKFNSTPKVISSKSIIYKLTNKHLNIKIEMKYSYQTVCTGILIAKNEY